MFNDVCVEYMVKKKNTILDYIKQAGVIFLGLAVSTVIINFVSFNESALIRSLSTFGYLASIGVLYLAYNLVKNMNIEYEYILTNGDMDIDKIMAKSSRKRMVSVKCNEIESFGKYQKGIEENKTFQEKFFLCDSLTSENLYYFIGRSPKHGKVFVVMNANDKVLNAMKPFLPKEIKL
jgi:hypothetical protein